ncbi:substrate-binding domain-containing protein [candidate division KSB1 bacterium]|nr:substrate-binding domain-containing protein [candidate division KSB1 bacterium]
MKRFVHILASMLIIFAMVNPGCQKRAADETAPGSGQFTVGVSLLTREHPFYRELEAGMLETANKENIRLLIDAGEWDLVKHFNHVDNFIVKQVNAIILCPCDSKGIIPAIDKANEAGIPVFTSDIRAMGGKVVAHIASDNELGGKLAGEYMVKLLKGKGRVAILEQPNVETAIMRVVGFKKALAAYPEIQVVAQLNGEGVRDKGMRVMEDILQSHQQLDGVFAINDESALGALAAIEAANRKNICLIGFDAQPEALLAIQNGNILVADVAQYPRKIAQLTIETIAKYLRGETVPEMVPVEVGIIDRAALAQKTDDLTPEYQK